MLKIIIATLFIIPAVWAAPAGWIWTVAVTHSLWVAALSLVWLKTFQLDGWAYVSLFTSIDALSVPLLVLTAWLLPLVFMATLKHSGPMPINHQRMFITTLSALQASLYLAFSATDLVMFYIAFEMTLLPTLIVITRWGNQAERLKAGIYFLFYTLLGSLPLLVALLYIYNSTSSCSMLVIPDLTLTTLNPIALKLCWLGCLIAFVIKLPMYGFHLWLPKAHVEAPIAGSMVLAAVLLKLGGYGVLRLLPSLGHLTNELNYPLIVLSVWGAVMTASICLRQTDLKSLIAYSSVSHMGLVLSGILISTKWGFTGAITLMIAHALTSSVLFCLANTNYERTHSRTLMLARGLQMILPLMGTWWFIASLANLGMPPLPNLMAELMIFTSLFNWCNWTFILMGATTLITVIYSLYMYITTQRGQVPKHMINLPPSHTREHLTMALHLLPLIMLITKPYLIFGWSP
uniref:NADH dehydrogenase subunit 4 n=1 Tax=Baldwinella vivanus TaxID=1311448 RepID=UPI0028FCA03B|nr:NADH dehydrogenase subunit 4 [Baldwinella vivanus]WNH37739.1 NADH dehydrogenase subunit 4 [Baldwinella vivanus]